MNTVPLREDEFQELRQVCCELRDGCVQESLLVLKSCWRFIRSWHAMTRRFSS